MEELLNKLIKKWWKPRNKEEVKRLNYHTLYREVVSLEFDNYNLWVSYSIRDLVSKESWLRQFCCETKLIEQWKTVHDYVMKHICYADENRCWWFSMCNAEYYIMMCSLLEESELEQFLIDNIKIEWK